MSLPGGSNMDLREVGSSFPSAILILQTSQAQRHHVRPEQGLLVRLSSAHLHHECCHFSTSSISPPQQTVCLSLKPTQFSVMVSPGRGNVVGKGLDQRDRFSTRLVALCSETALLLHHHSPANHHPGSIPPAAALLTTQAVSPTAAVATFRKYPSPASTPLGVMLDPVEVFWCTREGV